MAHPVSVSGDGAYVVLKVCAATARAGLPQVVEAHAPGASLGIRHPPVDLTETVDTDTPLASCEHAYPDFQKTPGGDR